MNTGLYEFVKQFHGPMPQDWSYKGIESASRPSLANLLRLTPYSMEYIRSSAGLDEAKEPKP